PAMAVKRKLVPPASSVRTTRLSFSNGFAVVMRSSRSGTPSEKRERRQIGEARERNEDGGHDARAVGHDAHEGRQRRAAEDRHAHQPREGAAAVGAALDGQREDERPDVGEAQAAEDDPGERGGSRAEQEKPEARETQERAPAEEAPGVEKVEDE